MRHPSKVGSFCARYVRKGMSYDRAKERVQTKIAAPLQRAEALEQLERERKALADLGIKDTVLAERYDGQSS